MLYSEFVEGTGCRETDYNYKVYKELEIIYMNTDCSKQHIYDMGKKLVDNSPTEAELQFKAEVEAEIKWHNTRIADYKVKLNSDLESVKTYKEWGDDWGTQYYKNEVKWWKEKIKEEREMIRRLKLSLN